MICKYLLITNMYLKYMKDRVQWYHSVILVNENENTR